MSKIYLIEASNWGRIFGANDVRATLKFNFLGVDIRSSKVLN